jgi:hypothetical protein
MTADSIDQQRRALVLAAGLAATGQAGMNNARAATVPSTPAGKAGDFDFLSGSWTIKNKRLKEGHWDGFDGEATVVGILGGVASVEELRIPSRNFSGMGLRILDVERKRWADYWCNGAAGTLNRATWGGFEHGAGTWDAHEMEADGPVIVRGVWDQITPNSCRWRQLVSRDAGVSWEENWVMQWSRAPHDLSLG